jgi:hypothetical protein
VAVRPLRPATDRRLGRLLPHQPANRPQAHPPAPPSREALLAPLDQSEHMRACRRFLAGIPHCGVGHPCVTHPSATPSRSVKPEDVRLACVRHAASVYPEPGSNSPSVYDLSYLLCARSAKGLLASFVRVVSRDPGQAVVISHLAVRRFIHTRALSRTRASFLTGTVVDACASLPVAVLLSTLQLSKYYLKQVLLASLPPSRDR